jgi:hypothetical protein
MGRTTCCLRGGALPGFEPLAAGRAKSLRSARAPAIRFLDRRLGCVRARGCRTPRRASAGEPHSRRLRAARGIRRSRRAPGQELQFVRYRDQALASDVGHESGRGPRHSGRARSRRRDGAQWIRSRSRGRSPSGARSLDSRERRRCARDCRAQRSGHTVDFVVRSRVSAPSLIRSRYEKVAAAAPLPPSCASAKRRDRATSKLERSLSRCAASLATSRNSKVMASASTLVR